MLTATEIRDKATRKYPQFLRCIVTGESFFPLAIRFGKPSPTAQFDELQAAFTALRDAERSLGFVVQWCERKTSLWGKQNFPEAVAFHDEANYLAAIGKTKEIASFRCNVDLIRQNLS